MLVTRLPLISAICLCALICGSIYWQLSPYIYNYLNEQGFNSSNSLIKKHSDAATIQNTKTKQQSYNISSYKLFGDARAPVKSSPVETEKLPETTLKLRLTGVLAGKNNIQASALIEGPDRKTRSYRIDEELPGGAILKQVYPDRVVLERTGRLENLIFDDTRPIGIESQTKKEPIAYTPQPSHSVQSNMQNFNKQQTQQIKDRLSKLRSRLQSNGP
ncbi:MAG: general secretion pathway protein C [Oleiphilaceae bacterium]|jgi:general secretion pathway protein C